MKTLLLWDIDGTLLSSSGAGLRALRRALVACYGIEDDLTRLDWAGRTDRYIVRRIFEMHGIAHSETESLRYLNAYIDHLPEEMAKGSRILPGVGDLVADVATRKDAAQGLLTGNLKRGAMTKLGFHGLWSPFTFGAFADDAENRNDLSPVALRRAREHTGHPVPAEATWVIGDTPHDIACGKVIGARTLAVATGHHSLEELLAHAPTAALADLSDVAAVRRLVGLA